MSRREATAVLVAAVAMLTAAATWLFGPYGLAGAALALLVLVLFVVDVEG